MCLFCIPSKHVSAITAGVFIYSFTTRLSEHTPSHTHTDTRSAQSVTPLASLLHADSNNDDELAPTHLPTFLAAMSSSPPAASSSPRETVVPIVPAEEGQSGDASSTPAPSVAAPPLPPSPSSSRRALTFEEFRAFYVASKQSDFARQATTPEAVHYPQEVAELRAEEHLAEQQRRRHLAAELCADLTALAQQRHGDGNRATAHGGVAATVAAQRRPPGPGVLKRLATAFGAGVGWLVGFITDNIVHVLQFSLLGYLVYTQSEGNIVMLLLAFGAFAALTALRAVVRSFRIGHESGTVAAPSFLGRLFKPEGHTGPVSQSRKLGYIVAKCFEALLLSVFPTYSVERLETELGVDGIVR